MSNRPSTIVVGAGHNGLVAANYLAMAGQRVLVLERRDIVGGACITEELFPGYRVSSCSYICHILQDRVIEDLELRKHGFEVHAIDPLSFQPFPDGRYVLKWYDEARTEEQVRSISAGDAANLPRWRDFWERASAILHRYFLTDPPTEDEVAAAVKGTPDESILERMLTGSMKDLVEEHFESEAVRALYIDAHDAGDVRAPGSIMAVAYIKCSIHTKRENLGIPHGGMGGITVALARAARARGVEIRTGVEIDRIVIRDGRAAGVRLKDGATIEADAVLSNADPKRTFLKLVSPDDVDADLVRSVRDLKTEVAYLKFHCALKELPDFTAWLGAGHAPQHLAHIRICPSVAYYEQAWDDARQGRVPLRPVLHIQIPTVYDTSLTEPGHHVMSVWALYAPVRLREGNWEDANRTVAEHMITTINEYAPNFRDAVEAWELFTPRGLEQRVYLTDGNIRHLDITREQMLADRPNRRLSGYRTPIDGLYLCGAGTHPGGEVTGAPGHNAARAVLRDRA